MRVSSCFFVYPAALFALLCVAICNTIIGFYNTYLPAPFQSENTVTRTKPL
nr:MAG TPA_asm: hypothetical protein [Caudoviricetes sp.]